MYKSTDTCHATRERIMSIYLPYPRTSQSVVSSLPATASEQRARLSCPSIYGNQPALHNQGKSNASQGLWDFKNRIYKKLRWTWGYGQRWSVAFRPPRSHNACQIVATVESVDCTSRPCTLFPVLRFDPIVTVISSALEFLPALLPSPCHSRPAPPICSTNPAQDSASSIVPLLSLSGPPQPCPRSNLVKPNLVEH